MKPNQNFDVQITLLAGYFNICSDIKITNYIKTFIINIL